MSRKRAGALGVGIAISFLAAAAVAFALLRPESMPVVWAVGDGATGEVDAWRLARRIAADDPDRFLYLGDVYDEGRPDEFRKNYEFVYGGLLTVTEPTPGDHEWGLRERGYFPFWEDVRGSELEPYYAVELGDWELLSLNSEAPHGPDSPQVRWLRERVASSKKCRIAFWHRPRYHSGTDKPQYRDVAPLWNALRGRATAVLSGDEHNMQRLRPRDGITQFVVGSGGRRLYELRRDDGRLAFGNDEAFGALRLELRPTEARYAFVTAAGRTLDSGTLPCRG